MMRSLARLFLALLLVALAAALAEGVLEWRDRRAHPMRGILAAAGGHHIHMILTGRAQPGPTVLLECGIGGATAATWAWVQHGVERFAPVVSYDRAGLGDSDPGPMPRDGRRLVEELHAALVSAGIRPPFVFVGHSYGGLLARLYVARYPDEVAGVVLCESSHPDQFARVPGRPPRMVALLHSLAPAAPWAARFGLLRAFFALVPTDTDKLPPVERAEQHAYLARASHWSGTVRELAAWAPLTNPEARATSGFGARPLVVLTAGASAAHWGRWRDLQAETARLSSDSVHRIEPGATHGSLIADSTHAEAVVVAVHDVVEAVRSGRSLAAVEATR